ncbi:hypothetical protein PR048_025156 [Dryococelus australis]|uniref:Uncharacterized protein n=1 Tax=Dryococelus australis TaxID=614101 RepID=A0ABQ9GQK3_9NEOP|nr:hypothetical protein PR048_025156 [Dryococelus australis]
MHVGAVTFSKVEFKSAHFIVNGLKTRSTTHGYHLWLSIPQWPRKRISTIKILDSYLLHGFTDTEELRDAQLSYVYPYVISVRMCVIVEHALILSLACKNLPTHPISCRIIACGNRAGRCRWFAGFLGDLLFPPALLFRCCSMLTSITLIGSQELTGKSRPNLFTHSRAAHASNIAPLAIATCRNAVRQSELRRCSQKGCLFPMYVYGTGIRERSRCAMSDCDAIPLVNSLRVTDKSMTQQAVLLSGKDCEVVNSTSNSPDSDSAVQEVSADHKLLNAVHDAVIELANVSYPYKEGFRKCSFNREQPINVVGAILGKLANFESPAEDLPALAIKMASIASNVGRPFSNQRQVTYLSVDSPQPIWEFSQNAAANQTRGPFPEARAVSAHDCVHYERVNDFLSLLHCTLRSSLINDLTYRSMIRKPSYWSRSQLVHITVAERIAYSSLAVTTKQVLRRPARANEMASPNTNTSERRPPISGVEVDMEPGPECKGGGTGDRRENPPTSGIVRHDSQVRKSRTDPAGNLTRFVPVGNMKSLGPPLSRRHAVTRRGVDSTRGGKTSGDMPLHSLDLSRMFFEPVLDIRSPMRRRTILLEHPIVVRKTEVHERLQIVTKESFMAVTIEF